MFISHLPSHIRLQTQNALSKGISSFQKFKKIGVLLAFGLCYSSSHAVSLPASNLKVTVKADTVVLTWNGTAGVLYQAESAANTSGPWQSAGEPTTAFSVTNVSSGPLQFYRVGIFTNTVEFVAAAAKTTGDKAPSTVPTLSSPTAPACNQVVLSWSASTDQGTKVGGTTYTSGLKGYNVYRGGVFLKQVLAPATSTTDTSVSGSTSYSYTVSAIDNLGNASSQSSARSVTTPACATCFAVIGVGSSPSGAGAVSGGTTVNCGTTVTVTASANSGYTFANWTENGSIASSSASYSFVANASRTLVANFTPVSSGPALRARWTFDTGTVSGSTATDSSGNGNNAILSGSPLPTVVPGKTNQAISLDGYSGAVTAPDAASLNMTGPFTVATWVNFNTLPAFSQYPSIVAKLTSPSSCYGYGISWNGAGVIGIIGSGSPSWTVTPASPAPVVGAWNHYAAVFDGSVLKLYVNGALHSQTVATAPASSSGAPIKMGAHYGNPSVYGFVNGKFDDDRIYGHALTASDVATLYSSAGSVAPANVSITTSSAPSYGGSTSGGGTVVSGTSATVTASPYSGYSFANWTENGAIVSYSSTYTFTANANRALVANFIAAPCTFTISGAVFPSGAGSVSGGGIFGCGSTVTMTAAANAGYTFMNWTENGNVVSTLPIYVSVLNGNRSLVANFAAAPVSYTITTSSSPSAGGSTSGGRTVSSGTSVTVTASPNAGYSFVNWTENGIVVSTSSSYTLVANANRNLVANFGTAVSTGSWAKRFGGASTDGGNALVTDSTGNIYIAGFFQGSVDLGGGFLTSAGGYDLFLAKYSSTGVHLWSRRFGGSGDENVRCIALDAFGNILIGGNYIGSASLGGINLPSVGQQDAFLAKYSTQGVYQWSVGFGGTMSDEVGSIVGDSQGNVIVTGWFQSQMTPLNITGTDGRSLQLQSRGQADTFVAKFSANGIGLWAKSFLNGSWDQGSGVAVDRSDNILLAGFFQGWINFGGGQRSIPSGYLAKFSPAGDYLWDKQFGYSNGARVYAMRMDGNGDVVVAGDFHGQTDLGGGTITGTSLDVDFFVAKYSGVDGTYRWGRPILGNGSYGGDPTSLAVDAQNNVFVTGYFRGTYNFGAQTLTGGGLWLSYDGYVAKYTSNGAPVWAQTFGGNGGSGSDQGNGIAVDSSGSPVVTGYFSDTASFDGSSQVDGGIHDPRLTLTSGGGIDIFLARFNP